MMLLYYLIGAALLAGLTFALRRPSLNPIFVLGFLGLEVALNVYAIQNIGLPDSTYFQFDYLSVILTTVGTVVAIPTFYHSYLYLKRRNDTPAHESIYYASLMMLLVCMNLTYFAAHLGALWAFMEGTTLFLSLLIYHERRPVTLEATWKYVFISSIGVAMAFIGILFLSIGLTRDGVTDLYVNHIIEHAADLNPLWLKIAFVMLLVGFSGKMGVFPFHTISIDALAVAPPPVMALVGSALKGVGFAGIFRMYSIISHTAAHDWANNVLLIAGVASVGIAALEVSKVKFFPRLLGYSSVEHMGLLLICMSMGRLGYFVAVFHMILHSFAKAGFFLQMGQVHDIYLSNRIVKCGNYFKAYPLGAITVIFAFLSITAMPPSGMFVTEVLAFQAIFEAKYYVLGVVLLLFLTIILYFFAKDILQLLFHKSEMDEPIPNPVIYKSETVTQWLLLGAVIYLGFFTPLFLLEWINGAIQVLHR